MCVEDVGSGLSGWRQLCDAYVTLCVFACCYIAFAKCVCCSSLLCMFETWPCCDDSVGVSSSAEPLSVDRSCLHYWWHLPHVDCSSWGLYIRVRLGLFLGLAWRCRAKHTGSVWFLVASLSREDCWQVWVVVSAKTSVGKTFSLNFAVLDFRNVFIVFVHLLQLLTLRLQER